MRDRIWRWAAAKQTVGVILPRRLLLLRAILYPLDYFYWSMSRTRGYDVTRDMWDINGVRYSGAALKTLAKAQGETYRIIKTGDCVTIERLEDDEMGGPK